MYDSVSPSQVSRAGSRLRPTSLITLSAGHGFFMQRSLNALRFLKAKPGLINRGGSCVLGDKFLRKHLGSPWWYDGVGGESNTQNETRGKRIKNCTLAEMELLQARENAVVQHTKSHSASEKMEGGFVPIHSRLLFPIGCCGNAGNLMGILKKIAAYRFIVIFIAFILQVS